jgi:type II secretory pathway predicted ATPase ExeA
LGTKAGPALGVPPFHFGGVVPPEYFTDRREELREAERIVRGRQSLLLVGEHRAGKTSFCKMLIHQMMNAPNNDLLAVYVNVQTWPVVTIGTFLEHTILNMIGEIARQVFGCKYMALAASDPMAEYPALREDELFRAFVDRYRLIRKRTYADGPSAPAPFQAQEFVRFHHELSEIVRDKGWGNSVIFYDEANRLPRELSVELLLSHEEALSMAGITSVFAASPAMLEAFEELQDSFGHQLHLGPFRERSDMQRLLARYCFHDASRTMDIPLSSSALELLWRLSQGKPFLIQLIAGESFKQAAHRGDQVVDDRHVQEAHSLLRRTKPRAFTGPP